MKEKYYLDKTASENIIQDLKLKEVHLSKKDETLTGNPFLDKSWVTRYKNPETDLYLNETPFNNFKKLAQENPNKIAIYEPFKNLSLTYEELLNRVMNLMVGLKKMGINESSRVGVMLNGCVDEATIFLALNGLGATQKYIDFLKSVPAIIHSTQDKSLQMIIMEEMFLPLEPVINENKLPIIVANAQQEYEQYKTLEEISKNVAKEEVETALYNENRISIIINSSGTTGEPKPICHSDYSINTAALKMLYTDFPLNKHNALIKMMPIQLGIGLITTLYTGLISGQTVVIFGGMTPEELGKKTAYVIKNFDSIKQNCNLEDNAKLNLITAPIFFRMLMKNPELTDLSCLGSILTAGSKMNKEELDDLATLLQEKNCYIPICNAYGQNEQLGAITTNTLNFNKNGSAGYPVIGTNIKIVNPTTYEPVKINEEGLILVQSDTEFMGYDGLEEETKKAKIMIDGKEWDNSNDLGWMDKDGHLFITGRITRVAIRNDFKFSLDEIEHKIKLIPTIEDCVAIVTSEASSWENITFFIKTSTPINAEEVIKKSEVLSLHEYPTEIITLENIPYVMGGKPDYKKLLEYTKANNKTRTLKKNKI